MVWNGSLWERERMGRKEVRQGICGRRKRMGKSGKIVRTHQMRCDLESGGLVKFFQALSG